MVHYAFEKSDVTRMVIKIKDLSAAILLIYATTQHSNDTNLA